MKGNERAQAIRQAESGEASCSEVDVIEYLKSHPDFFCHHQDLLGDLEVPHLRGTAVSLVERQVALLRERNTEARHRLMRILETARDNDRVFDKIRRLVLQLLETTDKKELIECVRTQLISELNADFCVVRLFDQHDSNEKAARAKIIELFPRMEPICGQLRDQQSRFLFGDDAEAVESAALIPLYRDADLLGVLGMGSSDASYFHKDMGTLFLGFVGDVLVRKLVS